MPDESVAELIDGRYERGPLIGRGGMGDVFRGRDVRLGRDIAIKCLRSDVAGDPSTMGRFVEEARSAARLSHPSIVTVYDSGEWNGVPFLIMECLPGRTLADELSGDALSPSAVRSIAGDLADALAAAHGLGIVHRDVKPSNVLLTAEGRPKLADFGIAKSSESMDHTQTGLIIGTPAYLAPERLEGLPATAESDVYALGVILYEALTGERPFKGDTPIALAHAALSSAPVPVRERNPQVDPELAAIVDATMAREASARPAAAELAARLRGVASSPTIATVAMPLPETTTVAAPAPTRPPERRWADTTPQRRRLAMIGVVVAATVALIAFRGGNDGDGGGRNAPVTDASGTSVPAGAVVPQPLDDALDTLEKSVKP